MWNREIAKLSSEDIRLCIRAILRTSWTRKEAIDRIKDELGYMLEPHVFLVKNPNDSNAPVVLCVTVVGPNGRPIDVSDAVATEVRFARP